MRLSRLEQAIVLLAAIGLCRLSCLHLWSEPRLQPVREHIDLRFQALRELLPAQGEIGYLSDAMPARISDDPATAGTKLYLEAQYALAPLVLRVDDDRAPIVIAQLLDPAQLEPLARAHGLRIVARAGPFFAVLGK